MRKKNEVYTNMVIMIATIQYHDLKSYICTLNCLIFSPFLKINIRVLKEKVYRNDYKNHL